MMDKSWIHSNRISKEYAEGVENFIEGCLANVNLDKDLLHCPCCKCLNLKKGSAKSIREHLYFNGFNQNYVNWIWHGESAKTESVQFNVEQEWPDSYHEEFETANMCEAAYENYTEDPEAFVKFLEEAEKPLYRGCKRYTRLSALVKLYNTKARHGMTDALFSDLLMDFGDMLPEDHNLPSSIYEAKKTLSCLSLTHEKFHACSNDCILYRKQYKDSVSCPRCGLSRWKLTKNKIEKKGVPAKVVWYFPPIPRFKRMFKSLETSKNLTWHADSIRTVGQLRHPVDSPSWRLVDHMWPEFACEPRNLRLTLAADGINPHSNLSSRYSCWPVMLATYNLPPNMCMKRKFIMLTMLISGPKQPGNDIDVYLEVLIDDLQRLWEGVDGVYDAYRKEIFTLKAVLLWTINDFPAYGNLSGCTTHGYYACPICGEDTYAKYLENGKKMTFAGHRRFLPRFHPYRRQFKEFNGSEELGESSAPLSGLKLFDKLSNTTWGEFGKKINGKRKTRKHEDDDTTDCNFKRCLKTRTTCSRKHFVTKKSSCKKQETLLLIIT